MAISRSWTERQTTPFSEMAGGRGEVRNCLCSAKWRTGDDGQGAGGREGCWLFALAVLDRLSLESRSAERFFVHSKCKFMSSSFFFPSSPLPKYRRPSCRTDGWMDGGRALNEDGDEEARLPCPAHPPRSSLPPPSLRPNVRPSLCPNLECQNADPSTALGPSLWTRARSTTDPFHLT